LADLHEKTKLLRGLLGGEKAYVGPLFANIITTQRCNLHCVGCRFHSPLSNPADQEALSRAKDIPLPHQYSDIGPGSVNRTPSQAKDISLPLFEKLCRELKILGTRTITLTGEGEPFLHPFLPEMVTAAKEEGLRVTIATNGTFLSEENIRKLIDSRVDSLRVSLMAATPREYEKIYPGTDPIFFTREIEGLKLCSRLKIKQASRYPNVDLYHPINRENFGTIDKVVEVAQATGANAVTFSPWKTFGGQFASLSLTTANEEALRRSLPRIRGGLDSLSIRHNIGELIKRYDIGPQVWRKVPCYAAWYFARVLIDGTVLVCPHSDIAAGNLNTESLESIWNGPVFRAFRMKARDSAGMGPVYDGCDCGSCGLTISNLRVHRYFKWLPPFAVRSIRRQRRNRAPAES